MEPNAVENIAVVIQLSVAPVFLLAGIAGMLNVLSIRLGRRKLLPVSPPLMVASPTFHIITPPGLITRASAFATSLNTLKSHLLLSL